MTRPVHWPSLTPDEAEEERHDLFTWVAGYRLRYPASVELPPCWSQHPDIVEALTALRDCERGCFDSRSAGCAAMDWQRARRDTDTMLANWISRLPCAIPGRTHPATSGDEPDTPLERPPNTSDLVDRSQPETKRSDNDRGYPTH